MTIKQQRPFDRTIAIAFIAFVILGLPEGLLGLAFPSMREEFDLTIGAIGVFLLASTIGFSVMSFNLGTIIARFGTYRTLIFCAVLRSVALLGIFLAPSWELIILAGFFMGFGSGGIDAGLNAYVAGYRNMRVLNWLHAFFGVGATIGPLVMKTLFDNGISWQWGYALVGITQLLLVGLIFATQTSWSGIDLERAKESNINISPWHTLRLPLVWMGIAMFFLYTGVEITAGQLSPTLFIDGRGISENVVATWIGIYWGSFTVGRFIFGALGNRNLTTLIRLSGGAMIAGASLIWVNPSQLISFLGLSLLGFALAPIFPMMIAHTERTLSGQNATNAIGFQMVGASLGISVLPWIAGLLAENNDLEIIGPYIVILAIILTLLYELQAYLSQRKKVSVTSS